MIKQLKNWLRGDADWKAERKLDQSGKKDAFLADAMDGYRSIPDADHEKAIAHLKAKLKNRTGATSTKSTNWLSIAAAAAVIGLISIFIFTQLDAPTKDVYVAQSTEAPTSNSTGTAAPNVRESAPVVTTDAFAEAEQAQSTVLKQSSPVASDFQNTPQPAVDPSNIEAGIMEEADLAEAKAEPIVGASDIAKYNDEAITESPVSTTVPPANNPNITKADDAIILAEAMPANEASTEEAEAAGVPATRSNANRLEPDAKISNSYSTDLLALNGTVIDENGDGLIGANIFIEGTNFGATTDLDGAFNLTANAPLPWTVNVDYIGFESRQYTIDNLDQPLVVTLEEGGQLLDEVVVTGYGAKKKRKEKQAETPKPVVGFRKMKRYIRKNLEYPPLAKQNNIQGTVTVRFFIGEDGTPELPTLQKTLGGGCDAEAIRLIEEGPKWTPSNTWATYTIVFNL